MFNLCRLLFALSLSWAQDSYDPALFQSHSNDEVAATLSTFYSPWIEGKTLHIKGTIDGHIYEYLSREEKNIKAQVDVIELNSLGGDAEYGLLIAKKIASYKKKTLIEKGHFCASACVVIYAAGAQREMEEGGRLGIHGARLGPRFYQTYRENCFVELDNGKEQFMFFKKDCQATINRGYDAALKMTNEFFDFMEQAGVSPELRKDYYASADHPAWAASGNVLRKPDWLLDRAEALKWNLVAP